MRRASWAARRRVKSDSGEDGFSKSVDSFLFGKKRRHLRSLGHRLVDLLLGGQADGERPLKCEQILRLEVDFGELHAAALGFEQERSLAEIHPVIVSRVVHDRERLEQVDALAQGNHVRAVHGHLPFEADAIRGVGGPGHLEIAGDAAFHEIAQRRRNDAVECEAADLDDAVHLRPFPAQQPHAGEFHRAHAAFEFGPLEDQTALFGNHHQVDDFKLAQPVLAEGAAAEAEPPTGADPLHLEMARFNGTLGAFRVSPPEGGIRHVEGIRLHFQGFAEDGFRQLGGGLGIVGSRAKIHIEAGDGDVARLPDPDQPVEQAHFDADVPRLDRVEKRVLAALRGEAGDFKLPLGVLDAADLKFRGGQAPIPGHCAFR